jgi:Ca2+-binding EF-hand superfamily protein
MLCACAEVVFSLTDGAAIVMSHRSAKLKLIFDLSDEDAGGSLSRDELADTLGALLRATTSLSLSPPAAEATAMFQYELADAVLAEADADGSGSIARLEFVGWVSAGSELSAFLSGSLLMFLKPK